MFHNICCYSGCFLFMPYSVLVFRLHFVCFLMSLFNCQSASFTYGLLWSRCRTMALYLICFDLIPALVSRSPSSRSSPPYFILSSKPFAAMMSLRHPDEFMPFHEALAGVIIFMNLAKRLLPNNFVHLKVDFNPLLLSHFRQKALPSLMSSYPSRSLISIGNLK